MRILLVEQRQQVANFVSKGLRAHGYVVEQAWTAEQARSRAAENDLMILDTSGPTSCGLEVVSSCRQSGVQIPIVVLSGSKATADQVHALDIGADDFLSEPYSFDELLARVRARLRPSDQPASVLRAGDIELDLIGRQVTQADRPVELTAREIALLELFLRRPRHVLSHAQILSSVWGYDFDPQSNLVEVYVGRLRRKLGAGSIETLRGVGYRLGGRPPSA